LTADVTEGLTLAPMQHADIADVLEIESVSFSNPWRERDFAYALEKAHGVARISRIDDVVLGYAVGFRKGEEFHLADFAVRATHQRSGVGSALLEVLLAELVDSGLSVITLEVRQSNQAAVRLYDRAGFHTVAIRSTYYSHPVEDALVMVKPLSGKLSDWIARAMTGMSKIGESD
jgi:[ribosomal protein S18]-alanine N-acetyltransferase